MVVSQISFGLGDEIADGEHESALADHHAAAFAQRAEARGGEGVVRDVRAQRNDGAQSRSKSHIVKLGVSTACHKPFHEASFWQLEGPPGRSSLMRLIFTLIALLAALPVLCAGLA